MVCHPDESKKWFDVLWQDPVDLFRSLDIPVRTFKVLLRRPGNLKVKSVDVEAWSPETEEVF